MTRPTAPVFRDAHPGEEDALTELEKLANLPALAHVFPPDRFPYPADGVRERWRGVLQDPSVRVGVAEDAEGMTALVAFDDVVLRHLAVRPDRWGTGLARTAVGWALAHADLRRLWCLELNDRALGLYEHLGWSRSERRRRAEWPPYPAEVELVRGAGAPTDVDAALRSPDALADAVRAAPLGVLATVTPDGAAEAALVGLAVTTDGDLVLDVPHGARKLDNIDAEPRVALVVGCAGLVSWQVEGVARVVAGVERERCAATYESWHPGSSVHDAGFVVVRVRPDWVRRYDSSSRPPAVAEGRPAWVAS